MANFRIRFDPDFKTDAKRTIDLRPFFEDPKVEEVENAVVESREEILPESAPSFGLIVSPAHREEERRERMLEIEREERAIRKSVKRKLLEALLKISETLVIFLLERFQDFSRYVNPFERKFSEERLAYLALSLPESVRTADQILTYFPLVSRTQRYKMLRMRRDKLAMYERVFKKSR